jgi:hypothetical protein
MRHGTSEIDYTPAGEGGIVKQEEDLPSQILSDSLAGYIRARTRDPHPGSLVLISFSSWLPFSSSWRTSSFL